LHRLAAPYTALAENDDNLEERNYAESMERETGIARSLRPLH
jgi:hypothetical protein